ncbi:E3 ubiquitin/ISG15 ligase TRIM25-like [Hyperolius riggenbachi]|uniref:E3 ubiquitin/ISG15 ligase TRIM25-like n=1 Tax=Hyperolius riggenbachi TaxID=752182 RepID=UPI0035A29662
MASADVSQELECSVCLTIYTDPVILRCGHNFCRVCIDHVLDTQGGSGGYSCPECRHRFMERPTLQRNIALRNIAERFQPTHPDQEKEGLQCTYCVDSAVPAVMSCLLCDASLCDNHLRVHSKAPEHILCDPNTSLENRKCSVHKKILEYYCTEDAVCICVSCRLNGEHRGHQVEMLDETENRFQSLEERRRRAQEKVEVEIERVTALFRDLGKKLEDLEKRVLSDLIRHADQVSQSYNDVIQQLEIKKVELSKKMSHIEEMYVTTDPLTVLQESVTGDFWDIEEGENEDKDRHDKQLHDGGDLDVAGISHTLHTGLSDIISEIKHTQCQAVQQTSGLPVYADILLDVNTAANDLHISNNGKTVSVSHESQNLPETPERFQYNQVLSSQSFSSGRHYWEVDVGGSEWWRVGMCYPSIARRGQKSVIGYSNKSWCLYRGYNQYSVIHDNKKIYFPDKICSNRVRICLDYEVGRISFYALCDPIRHLHTFTAAFTEPLHAGLWVWVGCIEISGEESADVSRAVESVQKSSDSDPSVHDPSDSDSSF